MTLVPWFYLNRKNIMKIAHFAKFGPNQAGISGTAIDMVMAERKAGIDSILIDYDGKKPCMVGLTSGEVVTVGPSKAHDADIIVRHSAIPPSIEALNKPQVMCLHGRPEYTFLLHHGPKKMAVIDEYLKCAKDPRYRGFINFWKEHQAYIERLLPGTKIDFVPAMVNMETYNPDGMRYEYGKDGGSPNILICDMFREDVSPFAVLMAAAEYCRKYNPKAKINIYGLQRQNENPVKVLIDNLKAEGIVNQAKPLTKDMDMVYRANDILVTPHRIATRVIREALASGLPIVAGMGCPYTKWAADARDTDGFAKRMNECWTTISSEYPDEVTRKSVATADENFSLEKAGEAAKAVYERILKNPQPKIQIKTKPMIYNFIAYAPGDKENLGKTYNQYMELVGEDGWACFLDHDAMFTTEDWYKQVEQIIEKNPEFSLLTASTNRIGNPGQRVAGIDKTHDILYHRKIGLRLQLQCCQEVQDVTSGHCISGVVMIVSKKAWKKAGGFKDGFLGVDNDFHQRVAKSGGKVGVAKGLYVYHYYRADGTGLAPVEK